MPGQSVLRGQRQPSRAFWLQVLVAAVFVLAVLALVFAESSAGV
jgi:hypothetical protein